MCCETAVRHSTTFVSCVHPRVARSQLRLVRLSSMSQVGWTTVTACLQDYLMNLQISYNQYSPRRSAWGSSIKYVTLFLTNFDTPSPLSRIAEPPKVRHIPEPPKDNPASICDSELCKERSY